MCVLRARGLESASRFHYDDAGYLYHGKKERQNSRASSIPEKRFALEIKDSGATYLMTGATYLMTFLVGKGKINSN